MEETRMIFFIIGLIIGLLILAFGAYYLVKESQDADSRKIYGIATAVGVIITVFMLIKLFV